MSHKRVSRSIVNFPAFNRNVEVNDTSLGLDVTNLVLSPRSSIKSGNRNYEKSVINQKPYSPVHSYSTTGSDLEGILDLSTKLSGFSSSSSLSWSEDYELEISKKVQLELEKLDKAFQGVGDIPPPHDQDEIAEWKHFFPHICILDEKTPTNSTENSDASSESEEETFTNQKTHSRPTNRSTSVYSRNQNLLGNKRRTEEQAQNFLNTSKTYNKLPRKLKSLEIEKYLKISSFKSPNILPKKQNSQPILIRQASKEYSEDASSDYTSLPYITATPLKSQIRKPPRKIPKLLTLPPILNNFRSISATPRQTSSKSMFVSLNFEKNSSAKGDQISLKNDLMKLFDLIPISNR